MVRKSQRSKQRKTDPSHVLERHCLDRRHGIYLVRKIDADERGNVVSYSLAYIDPTICSKDNGRALGYDNSHGYHHRHYKGKMEPVDFTSFTELEQRFEMEVRELRNEH